MGPPRTDGVRHPRHTESKSDHIVPGHVPIAYTAAQLAKPGLVIGGRRCALPHPEGGSLAGSREARNRVSWLLGNVAPAIAAGGTVADRLALRLRNARAKSH
jgi:hypothetical protein